ncbi:MAG: LptE family protein [Candidatus Omnitrophica bacterium]|nr:LptE family protein [Candidatus Omnitrophota bacterium]
MFSRFFRSMVYGLWSMVLIAGCGYTTKSTLPSSIKTIHVETFKNNIDFAAEGRRNLYLPLLEIKVRNAVINRFLFDGNLKISEADKADLVLKGQLLSYDRSALRYTDNGDVQEYRVHITVSLEMHNAQSEEAVWTETGFVGEATYFVTGASARSEEAAVEDAITDLARRIVERTVEDW